MIEAKKRKKTAPERGQQSFSLMMKRQIQIVFSMFHTKARNPNCSKDSVVPLFQKQFHLDERLAENLYLFLVSGAFAINQHHKWKKDDDWFAIQAMLLRFIGYGSRSFEKET